MRRPRNKIAALTLELRLEVMQMLDDGETYEAIREELAERGVSAETMPGDSAFLAYRNGEEYLSHMKELFSWKQKAERRQKAAKALELGGGSAGLLELGLYEAAERILEEIERGDVDSKDLARLMYALRAAKITKLDESKGKDSTEVAELKAQLEKAMVSSKGGVSPAALAKIEEQAGLL